MPIVGAARGTVLRLHLRSRFDAAGRHGLSMISLGLGELVAAAAGIQRSFFGGEDGIATNRVKLAVPRLQVRPQDPGLLPDRGSGASSAWR